MKLSIKKRSISLIGILMAIFASSFAFQNCSKNNFSASSVKGLSCEQIPQPDPILKRITCPSGIGSLDLISKPICELDHQSTDDRGRQESYYRYDMSPFYIVGTEDLPPNDYSFCGCANKGEVLNKSNGVCSCPSGQQLIQVGSVQQCGVPACNEATKPASRDAKACPYNAGEIYRSRSVSCDKSNPTLPTWLAGTWSNYDASACFCPVQGQQTNFNPQTGAYSCSCPAGQEAINNKCQVKAICNNDQEYIASTNSCRTFQCKSYVELSGNNLNVPARDFNTGICYYTKVINAVAYSSPSSVTGLIAENIWARDHGKASPGTLISGNGKPIDLGSKRMQVLLNSRRALKLTGSSSDITAKIYVDNFLLIRMNNDTDVKAYGTRDSSFNVSGVAYSDYIKYNDKQIPLKSNFDNTQYDGGTVFITPLDITSSFKPGVKTDLNIHMLDCGGGQMVGDVYLHFQ